MSVPVLALLTGKAKPFFRGELSGIRKTTLTGPVKITFLGLAGDEQADLSVHGGPGKAIHHYPFDHYARWSASAPEQDALNRPGAFGENISTYGLLEGDVCIGDQFQLGSAKIEISQGRQPCWKQAARLEWTTLPAMMVRERRSGWYYRVIEEGYVEEGEMLNLLDRPLPKWSVARVFGLLIAGDHKREPEALPVLATMDQLDAGWRRRAWELHSALSQI
jgi:MOSC domain-containing protein YiiM